MRRGVVILGATGSIGASSLDVLARHRDRFEIVALTAHSKVDQLLRLCELHRPAVAVIGDPAQEPALRAGLRMRGLPVEARGGAAAMAEVASDARAGIVIAAIVGAAGLLPTLAAARAGKRLLLANKEAIVCAGSLLMAAVREGGAELLPVAIDDGQVRVAQAGSGDAYQHLPRTRRLQGHGLDGHGPSVAVGSRLLHAVEDGGTGLHGGAPAKGFADYARTGPT